MTSLNGDRTTHGGNGEHDTNGNSFDGNHENWMVPSDLQGEEAIKGTNTEASPAQHHSRKRAFKQSARVIGKGHTHNCKETFSLPKACALVL